MTFPGKGIFTSRKERQQDRGKRGKRERGLTPYPPQKNREERRQEWMNVGDARKNEAEEVIGERF